PYWPGFRQLPRHLVPLARRPEHDGSGDEAGVVDCVNPLVEPMEELRVDRNPNVAVIRRFSSLVVPRRPPLCGDKLDGRETLAAPVFQIRLPIAGRGLERSVPRSVGHPKKRSPIGVLQITAILRNSNGSMLE